MSLIVSVVALNIATLSLGLILGRLQIGVKKAPLPKVDIDAEKKAEQEAKKQQRINEQLNSYDGYVDI